MNNKFKRIMSLLLSATLITVSATSLFGCNKETKRAFVEKRDKILFVSCVVPEFTDEAFSLMADCGFDMFELAEYESGPTGGEKCREVIRLGKKHGMDTMVFLTNAGVSDKYTGDDNLYTYDFSKDSELYEAMPFIGMADEPHYKHFDMVASWIPRYEKQYLDKVFYVNLFPEYVGESELGGYTYNKYVKDFCDKVLRKLSGEKWLAMDYYPYSFNENSQTNGEMFYSWLHNLAIMQTNLKTIEDGHMILHFQTSSFSGNREVYEPDMRQQLYMNLAFGAEMINCYSYAKPIGNELHGEGKISMLDDNGVPTHIYYDVQKIIKEARLFEKVYLEYQYDGTKAYLPSESYNKNVYSAAIEALNDGELTVILDKFEKIKSLYSTQETVVSQFYNKENEFAYIAVNYSDPIKEKYDEVIFDFDDDVNEVDVYRKGIKNTIKLNNNVLQMVLEPGEGCMIIPKY